MKRKRMPRALKLRACSGSIGSRLMVLSESGYRMGPCWILLQSCLVLHYQLSLTDDAGGDIDKVGIINSNNNHS